MTTLLLAFVIMVILLYLILTVYLKCKMPFWSKQPVFHMYNLRYWVSPPGLISADLPLLNKYVDFLHINTWSLNEDPTALVTIICNFIKDNYIKNDAIKNDTITIYKPTKNNILAYLEASNHAGYVTVYQQPKLLFNKNVPESTVDEVLAVITARPLYVRFNKKKIAFPTYYVDNLCVHSAYRKKNLAANMIQTHYYNLRQRNKKIQTCLFKREGALNALVPLVTFTTYCMRISDVMAVCRDNCVLPPSLTLIDIGAGQLHLLTAFINSQLVKFACVILPDVTNIAHLIKTENVRVYALMECAQIVACYVFRLTELTYDGQRTCECIATLTAGGAVDIFRGGFGLACTALYHKGQYTQVLIEETAHTPLLFAKIPAPPALFRSPTAFFFYNYACYSIKNSEVLIIY